MKTEDTRGSGSRGENGKERRQRWTERKLEMAKREDVEVISRRAAETNDFIRLLTANDFIVNRLRNNLGRRNGVPAVEGIQLLERNEQLRLEMNQLNAEMCQAMNMDYKPPRGFENPLPTRLKKTESTEPTS